MARLQPEQMQKIEELCQSHEHMVHGEMQLLVYLGLCISVDRVSVEPGAALLARQLAPVLADSVGLAFVEVLPTFK